MSDEVHGSVLPIVAGDWVVMFVPENSETKVFNVRDVNVSVKPEEPGLIDRPPGLGGVRDMGLGDRVRW